MSSTLRCEEISRGIYKISTSWVNFYAISEGEQLTLVDTGYRGYYKSFQDVLHRLGRGVSAVEAVLVTHHHVDHIGAAEMIRGVGGADVYIGMQDLSRADGRQPSRPPRGFYSHSWRPTMMRYLAHTVRYGGAKQAPVRSLKVIRGECTLDVPGHPRIVQTPGHTRGHYSVALDDQGVVFTGDALVNFDYTSGEDGIKLHRLNENRDEAAESLRVLERLDGDLLLFGHGKPCRDSPAAAVARARERAEKGP